MGFMEKLLSGGGNRSTEDYVELDLDDVAPAAESRMQVHVAELNDQEDVVDIKDAIYDGDLVIADITRLSTSDSTMDRITEDLRQVAREIGGDIVQKGDDQLIVTPAGVSISRQKLGR